MLYPRKRVEQFSIKKAEDFSSAFVRAGRLELPHLAAPDPKSGMSTNSITPALQYFNNLYFANS